MEAQSGCRPQASMRAPARCMDRRVRARARAFSSAERLQDKRDYVLSKTDSRFTGGMLRPSCARCATAASATGEMDSGSLRARRELRRREIRRRRRGLAALSAAVLLGAAAAIVIASSSGHPRSSVRLRGGTTAASKSGHAAQAQSSASATHTVTGPPGTAPVPILMYHVIAAPPPGAPFPGLYVQPRLFAEQMQALKQAGWHSVTQDQVEAYWRRGVSPGAGKPIVISFDNGYQSQYSQALDRK